MGCSASSSAPHWHRSFLRTRASLAVPLGTSTRVINVLPASTDRRQFRFWGLCCAQTVLADISTAPIMIIIMMIRVTYHIIAVMEIVTTMNTMVVQTSAQCYSQTNMFQGVISHAKHRVLHIIHQ